MKYLIIQIQSADLTSLLRIRTFSQLLISLLLVYELTEPLISSGQRTENEQNKKNLIPTWQHPNIHTFKLIWHHFGFEIADWSEKSACVLKSRMADIINIIISQTWASAGWDELVLHLLGTVSCSKRVTWCVEHFRGVVQKEYNGGT